MSVRHTTPAECLRFRLADRRARGEPFEQAWQTAVRIALRECRCGQERIEWSVALEATRGDWLDVTLYTLRHTHASLCHYAGLTVPEAARRLGHGPALHITTYAHVIDGMHCKRYDGFDALITATRADLMFRQCSATSTGTN